MTRFKPHFKLLIAVALISGLTGAGVHVWLARRAQNAIAETPPPPSPPAEVSYPYLITPGSTFASALTELGVRPQNTHEIVTAARPVIDLGRVRAGTRFRLVHLTDPSSDVTEVGVQISAVEHIEIKKVDGKWAAERVLDKVETKVVTFHGEVKSHLWASAEEAKMDPNLIIQLAEIFAWQVDFAREVRVGDRWRLSVEQKFVRGQPAGWGAILAAEYINGKRLHDAVLFQVEPGRSGYFSSDGNSLKRMFLKSPLRYARISSRFTQKRFHPVLKISRPHLGVDYAAPVGTPVRAVGDGVVTLAQWSGGGGNTIKVRHNSVYQTHYLHLSRFEKGVRKGARVQQGQIIGFVGKTGLATGAHLHFEFVINGKVVDPLSQDFPSADPIPQNRLAEFKTRAAQILKGLPAWRTVAQAPKQQATY